MTGHVTDPPVPAGPHAAYRRATLLGGYVGIIEHPATGDWTCSHTHRTPDTALRCARAAIRDTPTRHVDTPTDT